MTSNQESSPVKPNILVVDEAHSWRELIGNALKASGVRYEAVNSAGAGIERLNSNDEPQVTAVITDGLSGGWLRIVEAATEKGAKTVLMSNSALTLCKAAEMEISAFFKEDFNRKNNKDKDIQKSLQELVGTVVPSLTIG